MGYPYELNGQNLKEWGERLYTLVNTYYFQNQGKTFFLTTGELYEIAANEMIDGFIFSDLALLQRIENKVRELNASAAHHAMTGE